MIALSLPSPWDCAIGGAAQLDDRAANLTWYESRRVLGACAAASISRTAAPAHLLGSVRVHAQRVVQRLVRRLPCS